MFTCVLVRVRARVRVCVSVCVGQRTVLGVFLLSTTHHLFEASWPESLWIYLCQPSLPWHDKHVPPFLHLKKTWVRGIELRSLRLQGI